MQGEIFTRGIYRREDEHALEYELLKCIKQLLNYEVSFASWLMVKSPKRLLKDCGDRCSYYPSHHHQFGGLFV